MSEYQRLEVTEVANVTVVRFRSRRITEDIDIQELGSEMFAWWRARNGGNCF